MTVVERMLKSEGRATLRPSSPRALPALLLLAMAVMLGHLSGAQTAPVTTSVQGTIYRGDGSVASGTVLVSWPSFTTAANQAVTAGSLTVSISASGWLQVNLSSNSGASPAGTYYTAVFHLNDGTVNKEYWIVPTGPTAAISQIRAQLMPATVAVQTVSKQYVDSAVTAFTSGLVTTAGGTLLGPLNLSSDPSSDLQAATKHYVDHSAAGMLPTSGGTMTGVLNAPLLNGTSYPQTSLQQAINAAGSNGSVTIPGSYSGTDTFSNPNGISVQDLRTNVGATGRSVKEWGAKCDGSANDSAALQAALDYAYAHRVLLTLPAGTCMTHTLHYRGESIVGMGADKSALSGFVGSGEDVLANTDPAVDGNYQITLEKTRLEHFSIFVDQTVDSSASPARGMRPGGSGKYNRPMEANSIFSPGACNAAGCWQSSTHYVQSLQAPQRGTGAAWYVGNCGIAMPNANGHAQGFISAEVLDLNIHTIGSDPDANYQAKSAHSCGMYLQAWPYDSHFEHLAISAPTAYAVPMVGAIVGQPSSDGNTYKDLTFHSAHAFTTVVGAHNVIDQAQFYTTQAADTGEAPTGLVLDCYGTCGGWSLRNIYQEPGWYATQPLVGANVVGGAIQSMTVNTPGLGWLNQASVSISDATGSGAAFTAVVDNYGTLTGFTLVSGGHNYSVSPVVQVNQQGNFNPYYPLNLIDGFEMTFFGGNIGQGGGVYTVFDAIQSQSYGTAFGGGGVVPGGGSYPSLILNDGLGQAPDNSMNYTGMQNYLWGIGATTVADNGFANTAVTSLGSRTMNSQPARMPGNRQSPDFAMLGGGAANQAFTSLDDLFFTAEDLVYNNNQQALGATITADPTAPVTQKYATVVSPGTFSAQRIDGNLTPQNALRFQPSGPFPVRDGVFYAAVKADVATTQEWELLGGGIQGGFDYFADQTVNLTTSWQTVAIPYHVVGNQANHQPGLFVAGQPPKQATQVYVAWMAFVPSYSSIALGSDPSQSNQAATKHYVDTSALPVAGGTLTGTLKAPNSISKLPRIDVRHPDFAGGADPTGATDSTAAITLAITYEMLGASSPSGTTPCIYFPNGNYKVHGLRVPMNACMVGDGQEATVLQIGTDASLGGRQNLLTVAGQSGPGGACNFGVCNGSLSNMTLRGSGAASTGNLLELDESVGFHVENVKFLDHGGRAIAQNGLSEREDFRNIEIDAVRFSIDVGSVNETYWHDLHIASPGTTQTGGPSGGTGEFPNNGQYFYNINCPSGVCATSGTWLPDPHAAVFLGSAVNYHFDGFSVKPTVLQGAFKVNSWENVSIDDGYCEGYLLPAVNPCVTLIGKQEQTTLTTGISAAANIIAAETSSDWFPAYYGSTADVPTDGGVDGFNYILYPPDYIYGDLTDNSSIGGGIKKGHYECVEVNGHSTDGAHIATRGLTCPSAGNTAVGFGPLAWPAGTVLEISEGGSTSPLVMNNLHANSYNINGGSLGPYNINGCDDAAGPGNFKGFPCAEIVEGTVPDRIVGKGQNSSQLSVGNGFASLTLSGGTLVSGPIRVYQQGVIADYGVNNIFIGQQTTTALAATNAGAIQQTPSGVAGVQAQAYASGIVSSLTLTAPAQEMYSQNFGLDWQPPIANRTFATSLGGGVYAAGHQYNYQNCWIDTTLTSQSNNRVCFHGYGDSSPGLSYELWNGTVWVNVWNVSSGGFGIGASMQVGNLGFGYNSCMTWNSACLMQFSAAGAAMPTGKVLDLGSSGTAATGTQAVNAAYVNAGRPLTGTSPSLGGTSLAVGTCASATVTIAGATTNMAAVASPAGGIDPGDNFTVRAMVSAANTVKVKVCALTAGAPATTTYAVRVIQ